MYDVPEGVECELWVDKNSAQSITDPSKQEWVKVNHVTDTGELSGPKDYVSDMKKHCNCDTEKPIFVWGGPTVTWRIDHCKVQFAKVGVREFIPSGI